MSKQTDLAAAKTRADAFKVVRDHLQRGSGPMRLLMIRTGIRFEISTNGKGRLTAKAPRCTTILRKEFGLKGSRESLAAQFDGLLLAAGLIE